MPPPSILKKKNKISTIQSFGENDRQIETIIEELQDNIDDDRLIFQQSNLYPDDLTQNTKGFQLLHKFRDKESSGINCISEFGDDFIVEGGDDNSVNIWKWESGKLEKQLHGHSHPILCICTIQLNKIVATGSSDQASSIKVWDTVNGTCLKSIYAHEESISSLARIDRDTIASASYDKTIKVWAWKKSLQLAVLQGHHLAVLCISTIKKDFIISGSDDCSIKIWDWKQEQQIKSFDGNPSWVQSLIYLEDKNFIVCGSGSGEIIIYDVNKEQKVHSYKQHRGEINYLQYIKTQQKIVSAGNDQTIVIYDLQFNKLKQTIECEDVVTSLCLVDKQTKIVATLLNGQFCVYGKLDSGKKYEMANLNVMKGNNLNLQNPNLVQEDNKTAQNRYSVPLITKGEKNQPIKKDFVLKE